MSNIANIADARKALDEKEKLREACLYSDISPEMREIVMRSYTNALKEKGIENPLTVKRYDTVVDFKPKV